MTNSDKYADAQIVVTALETIKNCLGKKLTGVKLEVVCVAYSKLRDYLVEREPELVPDLIDLWGSSGTGSLNGELGDRLEDYKKLSEGLERAIQNDYRRIRCCLSTLPDLTILLLKSATPQE